ncbi:hypothetical protein LIER_40309 [Lithospermum erythrorhizon]|uniref:Uncharacterized protein n=1 Tax=Lithospermum erythrorhizon TaxID=34254 RepID=A0AAV3QSK4_LITER
METRSLLLNFEAQFNSFSAASSDLSSPAVFLAPRQSSSHGSSGGYRGRGGRGRSSNNFRSFKGRNNNGYSSSWTSPSLLSGPSSFKWSSCSK